MRPACSLVSDKWPAVASSFVTPVPSDEVDLQKTHCYGGLGLLVYCSVLLHNISRIASKLSRNLEIQY